MGVATVFFLCRLRDGVDLSLLRLFGFGGVNWVAQWYKPGRGLTPDAIADAFWAFMAFGALSERLRPKDVPSLFRRLRKRRR